RDVIINSNVLFEDGKFIHTRCFTRDITEQKLAEAARGRLAAIVDSSNDAIIGKTLEGIITSWNSGAEKVFGYSATEALGQSILIVIPPERHSEEPEILARIGRGESVTPFESVRLRKDGARIAVSATISPVKDAAGNVIGASKVARDITERKRTEEALRESHERTANILESITDGFCVLDANWGFTYLNGQAEKILQPLDRPRASLLGRNLWSEFPDFVGTLVEKNFRRALTDQTTVHFEMFYPPLAAWLQLRAYPSRNGLSVYFQDISGRKEAEKLLQRYRLLAEKARDIVWMARLDGEIVEVNHAAVEAYGYSRDEFLRINLRQLRDRSTLPQLAAQLEKAAAGGNHYETLHVRKNGTIFPVEENVTSAEVGGETLILSIVRDITERVDASAALRESGERFRTMADNMAQFAWMADASGWIFWYNQRWFDYTGTTLEEMQGWGWKAVQHPSHVDRVVEKFAHRIQTG
ncbi:MAG: PAS domain S-box protein, partial [Opitutaceae bacterium]